MSYMNRKNVLSEGFFDFLKKLKKQRSNLSNSEKKMMKDPKFKKIYQDVDKKIADIDDLLKQLEK